MIGTTINHPVAAQTRSSAVVEPAKITPKVTLGSASPRRADLLRSLGVDFDVEVVELDENAFIDELERDPRILAETIARAKFAAFPANGTDRLLLTADTLVACNGTVMGKPTTNRRLAAMLASMSGCNLEIATAVCIGHRGAEPQVEMVTTVVELRPLTVEEIQRYVATGAGMDKAGGLALQAQAKPFIRTVGGCWSNVVGLPLCVVSLLLAAESTERTYVPSPCSVILCGSYDR